ncbi:MAG: hypothetical protein ACFFD4_22670 [Candidatus Odinarchaeota archaeon]
MPTSTIGDDSFYFKKRGILYSQILFSQESFEHISSKFEGLTGLALLDRMKEELYLPLSKELIKRKLENAKTRKYAPDGRYVKLRSFLGYLFLETFFRGSMGLIFIVLSLPFTNTVLTVDEFPLIAIRQSAASAGLYLIFYLFSCLLLGMTGLAFLVTAFIVSSHELKQYRLFRKYEQWTRSEKQEDELNEYVKSFVFDNPLAYLHHQIESLVRFKWTRYSQNKKEQLNNFLELTKLKKTEKDYFTIPHWIMDSLKQVIEQYTIGHWFSSILLSGAIVEFTALTLVRKSQRLGKVNGEPKDEKAYHCLGFLKTNGLINDDLFKELDNIRRERNKITHLDFIKKSYDKKEEQEYYDKMIKHTSFDVIKSLIRACELLTDKKHFIDL